MATSVGAPSLGMHVGAPNTQFEEARTPAAKEFQCEQIVDGEFDYGADMSDPLRGVTFVRGVETPELGRCEQGVGDDGVDFDYGANHIDPVRGGAFVRNVEDQGEPQPQAAKEDANNANTVEGHGESQPQAAKEDANNNSNVACDSTVVPSPCSAGRSDAFHPKPPAARPEGGARRPVRPPTTSTVATVAPPASTSFGDATPIMAGAPGRALRRTQ